MGAPLEDDHQGAVYVFYGRDKSIQQPYRQVTDAEAESQQDDTRTRVISVFVLFVPASVCRRLLCRSAVLRSKSSRRSGRQWRRAGRPRCGSAGSCRHHLVRPSHITHFLMSLCRCCLDINGTLPSCRSRGVVRIQAKLTFEPEKVNIFNKDCRRGGKEVTCMSVIVCLSLDSRTKTRTKTRTDVGRLRGLLAHWLFVILFSFLYIWV